MSAIDINNNFNPKVSDPLDARQKVATLQDLNLMPFKYKSLTAYVQETDKRYMFNGTEWVEYEVLTYIALVAERCTQLEAFMEVIRTSGVMSMATTVEGIQRSVSVLETSIQSVRQEALAADSLIRQQIEDLNVQSQFDSITASINSINSTLNSVDTQINSLNTFKTNTLSQLEALSTQVATTAQDLTTALSDIQALRTTVENLDALTESQVQDLIDSQLTPVISRVSSLETDLSETKTSYTARFTQIEILTAKINPIETSLNNLILRFNALPEDLTQKINSLLPLLDSTYVTEEEFNLFQQTVNTTLETLGAQISGLQANVNSSLSTINTELERQAAKDTSIEASLTQEHSERVQSEQQIQENVNQQVSSLNLRVSSLETLLTFDKDVALPVITNINWKSVTSLGQVAPLAYVGKDLVLETGFGAKISFDYSWTHSEIYKDPTQALFKNNSISLPESDEVLSIQDAEAVETMDFSYSAPKTGMEIKNNKIVPSVGTDYSTERFTFKTKNAILVGSRQEESFSASVAQSAYQTFNKHLVDSFEDFSENVTTSQAQHLHILHPTTMGQVEEIWIDGENVYDPESWISEQVEITNAAGVVIQYTHIYNTALGAFTGVKLEIR